MVDPIGVPNSSPVIPVKASSPRKVWIYLLVVVVAASLIVLGWQRGFFTKTTSSELSPAEVQQINDFLNSNNVPPPTAEQVTEIKTYLNQTEPAPTTEEKAQILDYLNQ